LKSVKSLIEKRREEKRRERERERERERDWCVSMLAITRNY
jgi:hypothetical protein